MVYVENQRIGGKVVQHVKATLGRLDILEKTGQPDSLLRSGLRFSRRLLVLDAHAKGECTTSCSKKIGPVLLFEKLWNECCIKAVLEMFLCKRRFDFCVERAIFITVVHRLMCSGSDRAAEKWMRHYAWTQGGGEIVLHQLYRAMAWLGTQLPADQQIDAHELSPRCVKDDIEEYLFARRRTLLSGSSLVFLDTTSLYFEGEGGSIGEKGKNKDGSDDANQIVVGVVLDDEGQFLSGFQDVRIPRVPPPKGRASWAFSRIIVDGRGQAPDGNGQGKGCCTGRGGCGFIQAISEGYDAYSPLRQTD